MVDPQVYWPGDFPWPETLLTLGLFVAACCFLSAAFAWLLSLKVPRFSGLAKRTLLLSGANPLLLSIPCFFGIYERNTGRWAGLKAFLQVREADLQKFKAAHPGLSREQVVEQFSRTDPGPWEYELDTHYLPVVVYPTIMAGGPRMAVNFGGRGSDIAIFDPDTMWVVFSL